MNTPLNPQSTLRLLATSLFFTALGLSSLQSAGEPFHRYVGQEVDLHLSLRSPAESRAAWEGHPFAEWLSDPRLQAFFEPLWKAGQVEDEPSVTDVLESEFGLTWDAFFELFPAEVSASLFNLETMVLGAEERPDMAIMARYAGDAEQLHALMQIQFERNAAQQKESNPAVEHLMIQENFMGETLYLDETFDGEKTYIEDGYALVDGIFILATPETRLRSMVEAIKDGPADPLAETEAHRRSRERGGRGDLAVFLNLEAFLPVLNEALLGKAMESGAAMFGLTSQSLDQALRLEALQAIFFDVDLVEDGLSSHAGLIYREKAGLAGLLTYAEGPLPEARYVPEEVYSSAVSTFDPGAMLAALEALLATASPAWVPLLDMQLQNINAQTGVDLRRALLENFGSSLVSLAALPTGAPAGEALLQAEQVYVVALRDAEALSSALQALIDLVPGAREQIETQRFAGQTIYRFPGMPNPQQPDGQAQSFSYVVTRSQLIVAVGAGDLLKTVLSRIESGDSGFWQTDSTAELFDRVASERAVARSYADFGQMVVPIMKLIAQSTQFSAEGKGLLDPAAVPSGLEAPFHSLSETSEAEDGFYTRSIILKREAGE